MKKYLLVEKDNPEEVEKIRQWGADCLNQKKPCIIIFRSAKTAEITCDNWTSATHGILPLENRKTLEKPLSQLLNRYPNLDFTASEGHDRSSESLTHLWYTFINVPLDIAEEVATEVYEIMENEVKAIS